MDISFSHKLNQLQEAIVAAGGEAFVLPLTDEFLGEYMPDSSRRVEWLTGFTGSAGFVVIVAKRLPQGRMIPSAFFTDGRYTLQAAAEVDATLYELYNSSEIKPEEWLARHSPGRILYDPFLMTHAQIERLKKALGDQGTLVALSPNPVDALWTGRPAEPVEKAQAHPLEYAGKASIDKRRYLSEKLKEEKVDAAIITACDSIMWLLNIRGKDVPCTPFALCYSVLYADASVDLYINPDKLDDSVRAWLGKDVRIKNIQELTASSQPLPVERNLETSHKPFANLSGKRVLVDPHLSPVWFIHAVEKAGAIWVKDVDPCQLPKACKNAIEIEGARKAHYRDGIAVKKFLAWLEEKLAGNESHATCNLQLATASLSELSIMEKLEAFRAESPDYKGPSFTTIAGFGSNGAIVHYRATAKSNKQLPIVAHQFPGTFLLLDSGGQYWDGTTDVTRTVSVGEVTDEMKDRFTRVLKGHIALATAVFPRGTSGGQLDGLARQFLWEAGLDYDHGTGHGVGSYLSVHEGPQRISKRGGDVPLQPGMICSNEPGYYKNGEYGIRIESLVLVKEMTESFLCFETLTRVPIDVRAVKWELMTEKEKKWLTDYNAWAFLA